MLDWVWDKEIDISLYLVWLGQWGRLEIGVFKQILSVGLLTTADRFRSKCFCGEEGGDWLCAEGEAPYKGEVFSWSKNRLCGSSPWEIGETEAECKPRRGACWSQGLKGSVWAWKSLEQGRAFRAKKPLVACCDPVGDHLLSPLWPTVAWSNQEVHSDLHSQSPPYRHTHQHS